MEQQTISITKAGVKVKIIIVFSSLVRLWKEILNSDGQLYHQNQQSDLSLLIWSINSKDVHDIWHW
jgi:hypothetical protein